MKPLTVKTPPPGMPLCPLCGHALTMSIRIAAEHDPTSSSGFRSQRTVGADGECAACGFHARREVDVNRQTLSTQRVETVLLVCPDEPEPDRMAHFEEEADRWITKGQPSTAPFWQTPPASGATFSGGRQYGKSIAVDFSGIKSQFDDVIGNMKAHMDRMVGL